MVPGFDDLAVVEDDDLVGVADRREAMRDRDRRASLRELVASSRTSTGGLRRTVLAIAMRCFSPPEKR